MQIKRVSVPMDFSPPSRLALNYGIEVARKFGARLTVLHVVELTNARTFAEIARIEREHHEQSHRMLAALVAPENRERLDLQFVVKSGVVEDEILTAIQEDGTDLVVMGTHGRGLIGRWLIGSATQRVLREVHTPVLTVCHVTHRPAFDRILYATDLSEPSAERARLTLELTKAMKAELIAMHAVEVGIEGGAEAAVYLAPERLAAARSRMDKLHEEATRLDIQLRSVLVEGAAGPAIVKSAEQESADLIAIAIRRDNLGRNNLGSTAEHVIQHAHVPVLAIPVGGETRAESRNSGSFDDK